MWESVYGKHITMQLVVSREFVLGVLEKDLGVNKTLAKVRGQCYWEHCRENIEERCIKCTVRRPDNTVAQETKC